MQFGATSGANLASANAQANQMNAQMAQNEAWASGVSGVAGSLASADFGGGGGGNTPDYFDPNPHMGSTTTGTTTTGGFGGSDRRLKKNISKISESPSGLNIYSFEFKDSKYGKGLFQGVMSDEIPQDAVVKVDGYDHVNYNKLDVEFKQI